MRVVPFCGGGRDLVLQHESWKVVTIETNILRGYINCTYLKNLAFLIHDTEPTKCTASFRTYLFYDHDFRHPRYVL